MRNLVRTFSLIIAIAICSTLLLAEEGFLVLSITNTAEESVANVTLKCKGDAPPAASDRNGTARLKLPLGTQPSHSVVLQITAGDWVLISPWDGRVNVPSFDNNPQNFVSVVVARKSDKQMLASAKAVEAMASRVIKEVGSRLDKQLSDEERRLVLEAQAREFGLTPEEVDRAIREWSKKLTDPYHQGLAELYQKNYPKAVDLLSDALDQSLKELQEAQNKAANAADFLGQALFGKSQYRDAAAAFKKAMALRPDDPVIRNSIAVSLRMAGDSQEAERYAQEATAGKGGRFGPYHPATAIAMVNLALIYQDLGKYAEAENIFKQALESTERGFGPDDRNVADCLDHYAELLSKMGRRAEAEEKRTRARAILARREQQMRDKAIAESKQLLALKEQQLGPEHTEVATAAGSLGSLYRENKQMAEAEALFKRALAIREKVSGKDHVDTAGDLQRLSLLYEEQGRYAEAEPLANRALTILEREFGQKNPYRTLSALENYARILRKIGRRNEAAVAEAKAKAMREKFKIYTPTQTATPNASPSPAVDPRQMEQALPNSANVNPANVSIEGKPGNSPVPPVPPESKKPVKPKPKKRSND
ncbi:MAG: tetratricopeptide repeat protein [Acidobacteria bacterium]|nr:tetratricopeptide repeat protein [Acidobacteriota bacterium]